MKVSQNSVLHTKLDTLYLRFLNYFNQPKIIAILRLGRNLQNIIHFITESQSVNLDSVRTSIRPVLTMSSSPPAQDQ